MADFVDDAHAKGYSDDEISNYLAQKRTEAQAAGYDDHAIDDYLTGVKMPRTIPDPFLQRFAQGHPASFVIKQTKEGFHAAGGASVSPATEQGLRAFGIWNDPAKGQVSPLRFANEALMRPVISGVNTVMSLFNAGIAGAGALAAQKVTGEPAPEKTANEMAAFGQIAALLLGTAPYPGSITKPHLGPMGEVSDLKIGDLPTHQTVIDAARALGGPEVPSVARDKLVTLYEGKGLHPAEVVDDASRDPTVKQSVLSINKDMPYGATLEGEPPPRVAPNIELTTQSGSDWAYLSKHVGEPGRGGQVSDKNPITEGREQTGATADLGTQKFGDVTVQFVQHGNREIAAWVKGDEIRGPKPAEDPQRPWLQKGWEDAESRWFKVGTAKQETGGANKGALEHIAVTPIMQRQGLGTELLRRAQETLGTDIYAAQDYSPKGAAIVNAYADKRAAAASRYTAERDHEVPGQFVAKDEAGNVVAVGDSPEQAVQLARQREAAPGGGAPPEMPPPGGPPGAPPELPPPPPGGPGEPRPLLEGPPGPTIEHEVPKPPPMSYEDAKGAVLDRLSIGEPETRRRWTWSRLYTNFIDQLFPLSRATIRAAGKLDEPLPTISNPEHLARLLSGASGKAEAMLREPVTWIHRWFGVEPQKGGTFDFHTYANTGPSLEAILEPMRGQLDDFRAYVASRRAVELGEKGLETGIPLDAAARVVDEKFDKFAGIHGQLVDYQNRLAQYLRDAGVVSQKGYEAMVAAHENYVPFFRLFDEEEGFRGPGGSLQATNPIHRIKGSEAKIIDPIESIVKNTYLYTQMAERNFVGTTMVDLLKRANETKIQEVPLWAEWPAAEAYMKELGIKNPEDLLAFVQTAAATPEGNAIAVLRNGRRETYLVDPELARAFKGLDRDTMNMITRLLQIPASTLRAGAVLNPEFWARHILRDFQYAVITAKGAFTPADMARGFYGLLSKDKDYQNWLKSGGANISIASLDRNYLQESVADLTRTTGLGVRAQNVVDLLTPQMDFASRDIAKQLLHPLQVALDVAQSATHLGAFKKAIRGFEGDLLPGEALPKKMTLEAGYESRATAIDPARIGASMKAWNAITAFGNIALQDSDRIVRAFIDKPMTTSIKIAGAITLPSALLWLANHDDPDWQEIPQWQKDLFWIIPAWHGADGHKVFFRLPKPWATGLFFASGPERVLQNFLTDHPTTASSFLRSMMETTGLGLKAFTPTAASPVLDQIANENLFSGRTLIPQSMEKQLPEYQYTPYTTETAKRLGQSIAPFAGVYSSPILLENYLRGWTGTLGQYMLGITDNALRKQGVVPDPVKPTPTLADIPVVRAFAIRYPSANTQSLEDFHKEYDERKRYFDTFMAKAAEGDQEAMSRVIALGGPKMFVQLDAINEALITQNQVVRNIWKDPSMKPEEKRQLIDQIYYEMIDVARQANEAMKSTGQ